MSYQRDKVNDVLAVLAIMRNEFRRTRNYRNTTELRKEAVMEVAETELRTRRFINQDSALKSIHDACARRLEGSIKDFDSLADKWLRQNSKGLQNVLLRHSEGSSQRSAVIAFFRDNA
jgi:hypothetical protein